MASQRKPTIPPEDERLLIELFTTPEETYDEPSVLRLTRMTARELRAAVDEIAVEPVDGAFLWQDVAQLALHRWTPRHLASAVGNDLPYLNQTRSTRVELP